MKFHTLTYDKYEYFHMYTTELKYVLKHVFIKNKISIFL